MAGLGMTLVAGSGVAGEVYRSIDTEGNVTYSEEPPEQAQSVKVVPIDPPPTEQEVEEAARKREQDQSLAEQMEQSRQAREQQRAEQEKEKRQREIEQAQLQRLQQYDQQRYQYDGYATPYYPWYGRPPYYHGKPHHPGHRPVQPLPEQPPVRNSVANVPGRGGK